MAARLRSDSLHPCHHLSEPLRNMFWCRHCMKIFTDPMDRWRHSKTCREVVDNEVGAVSKQVSLKEGTLFRFGVWDADPVISRSKSGSSQYGIRIPGTGKVASHKGTVNPQNFALQCVICRQPFQSIDEMRIHVKTPCSKPPNVQNVNRFPPEITNVSAYTNPPVLVREDIRREELSLSPKVSSPKKVSAARSASKLNSRPRMDLFRKSPVTTVSAEPVTIPECSGADEPDGTPLTVSFSNDHSEPSDVVSGTHFREVSTINCSNEVSLVKLNGKIPKLQLSPVDVAYPLEPKVKADSASAPSDSATADGLKRSSNSDIDASPVKKSKTHATGKQNTAQIKKKTKRKKVVKKKSAKKKKVSIKSINQKQSQLNVCDNPSEVAPNTQNGGLSVKIKDELSDDVLKNGDSNQNKSTVQSPNLKKPLPRKPPRPRKCKICGRIYKSLELLQRHNKLPCRVKLTRNQCAKVLRSNSQTSESGRISQRRSGQKPPPPPPKVIPKRRQKKRAKKYPPPFRGNPRLPQYRLVYSNLSEKAQFFYKLDMVPTEALTEVGAEAETLQIDESLPRLGKELPTLSSIDVGELFLSDEHVCPPQLEKISCLDHLPIAEEEDDLGPPELELVIPTTGRHFMDMLSPSAEKTLKSVFSPTAVSSSNGGSRKKSKQGHISSKARRDRYSILHPIASHKASHKKSGQNSMNSDANGQSAQRVSQRLKDKALAKVPQDEMEQSKEIDCNPEETRITKQEKESIKTQNPKACQCKNKSLPCSCSSPKINLSRSESSPPSSSRKNLFESLSDISPEKCPNLAEGPKVSTNQNQNKLLQNICVAKSRLGQILSPVKGKVSDNFDSENKGIEIAAGGKSKNSRPKTRMRKLRSSSDENNDVCETVDEPVSVSTTPEPDTLRSEHRPVIKLKLARRSRLREESSGGNLKYTSGLNMDVSMAEMKPPSKHIKLPLLASRGVPRHTRQPGSNSKTSPKRMKVPESTEVKPEVDNALQSTTVLSEKPNTDLTLPIIKLEEETVVFNTDGNPSCSQVKPSHGVATVQSVVTTPFGETDLPSLDTGYLMSNGIQDIGSVFPNIDDPAVVHPSVSPIVNGITVDATEKVSVQYIDEVNALMDYSDIALIGDECMDTVDQPEGSCTTGLDYADMLEIPIPNHSVIVDGEANLGTAVNIHTIEPQFQTIQFS